MKSSLFAATCLVAVTQLASQSHAQQTSPAAQANAGTTIAEVVVTAEKREQSLQQVPVAISAYTAVRRDILGINSLQDLTNYTPGFSYSTSLDRAFIRGIGRETNNLATDAGVATYVDGLYNSATVAASGDSLFVQRVEILRGPQGTLYGRNSIGGTVNAISFRPTDTFYAEARGGYGNYGAYKGEAAVSGPISDNIRLRLAASDVGQTRGYFTNVANNTTEGGNDETKYAEVQFDATSGPFEAWIKADITDFHGHDLLANSIGSYDYNEWNTLASINVNGPHGYTLPGFTELGTATQNPGMTNIRDVNAAINNRAFDKSYNFTTQLTWHLPSFDIKYLGGYTHYHYHFTDDGGWLANGVANSVTSFTLPTGLEIFPVTENYYDEAKSYWSNEVDFVSTGNGPIQWVIGGYQYQEHYYQDLIFAQLQQPQLASPFYFTPPFSFSPAPLNPSNDLYYTTQTMTGNSYAAFGQLDWKFSDHFKFTGGLRYNHDNKHGFEHARILCFDGILCPLDSVLGPFTPALDGTPAFVAGAAAVPNAPGVTSPVTIDPVTGIATRGLGASWSAVTGTAGLEWTPDRETLVYGKYARGYKEGGFATGGFSIQPESFPETVDAFEVGAKKQFGNRFQANVSTYYYLYHNKQDPLSVQTEAGPNVTEIVNLSKVTLAGVELETIWQPTDNLQFLFNYAHIYSRINNPGQCFADVNDRFAQVPGANISGCPAPVPVAFPGIPNSQTQNLTGAQAPEATPNKLSLNGDYTFRLPLGNLTFSATYIWKDATYYSIFNRAWSLAPSFSQVDLRASFTDAKNRFTIIAYAKNVTNALGYDGATGFSTAQAFPFVPVSVAQIYGLTPPRTYGIELQVRFR